MYRQEVRACHAAGSTDGNDGILLHFYSFLENKDCAKRNKVGKNSHERARGEKAGEGVH